jgi:hypothetical protein
MAGAASAHQAATTSREQSSQQRACRTRRTSADPQRAQQGATGAAAAAPAALDSLSRLQQLADASPQVAQLRRLQALANERFAPVAQLAGGPEEEELVQGKFATAELPAQLQQAPRANSTGLPDNLKSGIENLSGMSMDHVKVHYNSLRPAQLFALAYAHGDDIHLAPGQEQHLPHEAWHVVQQAQGRVQPTLEVGGTPVNDNPGLELEADVMGAHARSPGSITTTHAPTKTGMSASAVVQGYFQQDYLLSSWLQSDDLSVVVEKGYPNHKLYAKAGKAANANLALAAVNSGIELIETGTTDTFWEGSRLAPTRQATLKKIEAKNKQNNTQGDDMLLFADCGKSNAVVVGSNGRKQAVYDKPSGGVTKAPGSPTDMKTAIMKAWLDADTTGDIGIILTNVSGQLGEMDLPAIHNEFSLATTEVEKDKVKARYSAKLDEIAEAYWKHYNGLDPVARDNIDKALKINSYANPGVGQGFTTSSGGPSAGKPTWNFHWGGVVMTSDDNKDKVVLENYAVGDAAVENKLWTFDLYGSKKDQSFHERHSATLKHGKTPTTMTIEKKP